MLTVNDRLKFETCYVDRSTQIPTKLLYNIMCIIKVWKKTSYNARYIDKIVFGVYDIH